MRVPMLVTGAAGGYAAWKPMMENYLLRQGVADGDYKVSNPDWAKLVTAVESWSDVERREAVAFVVSAGSSSSKTGHSHNLDFLDHFGLKNRTLGLYPHGM